MKKVVQATKESFDYESGLASIKYILAALDSRIEEWELESVTIQSTDGDDFRVILKGYKQGTGTDQLRHVCFTNGSSPAEALFYAEGGFRDGTARWRIDSWQPSESKNVSRNPNGDGKGLTFIQ